MSQKRKVVAIVDADGHQLGFGTDEFEAWRSAGAYSAQRKKDMIAAGYEAQYGYFVRAPELSPLAAQTEGMVKK